MKASEFIELIESHSKDEIKVQVHPLIYDYLGLSKVTKKTELDFMAHGYMGMISTNAQIFESSAELLYEATALIGADNVVKIPLPFWKELLSPQEKILVEASIDLVKKCAKRYYGTQHVGMPHTSIVINGTSNSFRNVILAAAVGICSNEIPIMRKDLSANKDMVARSVKKVMIQMSTETISHKAVWSSENPAHAKFSYLTYGGVVSKDYPLEEIYLAHVLCVPFQYSTYTEATKFEISRKIENIVQDLYAKMRSVHYDNLRKESNS